MSKYQALWEYIAHSGEESLTLTFAEVENIAGAAMDHSFLTYKKELLSCGYRVEKISMKAMTVRFLRMEEENG